MSPTDAGHANDWHRDEVVTPRRDGESAAEWQADLFDRLVRRDPVAAFGHGPMQDALWDKRVTLAEPYVDGGPVLDVGCGNGYVSRALAERTGGEVLGIDVSAEGIEYARRENDHRRVRYQQVSVEEFEAAEAFSLITAYEVLEHVDEPVSVLSQMRSWLRPGGRLVFSTPNRSSLNRRIKTVPGLRQLYERVSSLPPDAAHPGHVDEYHYKELLEMTATAGLEVERTGGAILLLPFPEAFPSLMRRRRFAELNVRSGDWRPSLATALYVVARRPPA
jgi:ubiquinone biosynthesis O-methyltransferase